MSERGVPLEDLKLLVDVAWLNRNGQKPYELINGEFSAADRLVKRRLLVNVGGGIVGITGDGDELVMKLMHKMRRA